MKSNNERVELAIQIMKCRELATRTTDAADLARLMDQIAQLEKQLREIDE